MGLGLFASIATQNFSYYEQLVKCNMFNSTLCEISVGPDQNVSAFAVQRRATTFSLGHFCGEF